MPDLSLAIVPVTPFQQNCCLVFETASKRGVVIDPGGDLDAIRAGVQELGMTVEAIWLTHGHIDHAGGAAELRDHYKVPIVGPHEDDLYLLESLESKGAGYGLVARNFVPDRWLKEGDVCKIGDIAFDILHCPGHSPGSVVFLNKAQKLAFVGDVLFKGSVGRTDLPRGSHDALIEAIKTKLLPLDDDVNFICGHGEPSTIGAERRSNPFLR